MTGNSQKFISRNRAPRVQIEYDVELYGSEKKVQLPFVMGVMSDLAGKSNVEQPSIENRQFLEIDADNFDDRMSAMKPRAAFSVPNTLTGEGNLSIDLTFEKMNDFSPKAIAAKIEPLRELLEARTQLSDLMTYMDGKTGAETLIEKVLSDTGLMTALSDADNNESLTGAALDSLRTAAVEETEEVDNTGKILGELGAQAPEDMPDEDTASSVLAALSDTSVPDAEPETKHDDALKSLRESEVRSDNGEESGNDALDALRAAAPPEERPDSSVADALAGLAAVTPEDISDIDGVAAALDTVARSDPDEQPEDDLTEAALSSLAAADPEQAPEDKSSDVLSDLVDIAQEDTPETSDVAAVLEGLTEVEVTEAEEDASASVLSELADAAPEDNEAGADAVSAALEELSKVEIPETEEDASSAVLSELIDAAPEGSEVPVEDISAALESLSEVEARETADGSDTEAEGTEEDELEALLSENAELSKGSSDTGADDDLDDLLADLEADESHSEPIDAGMPDDEDLNELLDDLNADADPAPDEANEVPDAEDLVASSSDRDSPISELDAGDDLDDLLADLEAPGHAEDTKAPTEETDALDDLDDLLADLDSDGTFEDKSQVDLEPDLNTEGEREELSPEMEGNDTLDDLDDLLADLDVAETTDEDRETAETDDLDDLLDDLETLTEGEGMSETASEDATLSDNGEFAFGLLSEGRPDASQLNRKRFRLAIMGDFSGRSARGVLETGDDLANRKAILLDPDTVEDVIEGFATTLVLPIGKDGAGVEVKLNGLDDLHPDELYENVEIFSELVSLRSQLGSGTTAESAMRQLREWGEAFGTPVKPPRSRSSGNTVPADLKLTDFQKLIGDTQVRSQEASPIQELMARIVGPHIKAIPDADALAMQAAVDEALSAAMRLVLHHPDFQSVEAQWRSIDLIARSIETDDTLEVMLYDVSAEEIAADLAMAGELSESGIARLLTEQPLDPELGRGGYSAMIGLYSFEETPPHAELLGRIARVAAHVDAPFLSGLSQAFMDIEKEDRHPLVATAWDTLRAMPEAGHLGLVSPRFLLRRPYGARSEPIYEFEFEEFTLTAGLRGMLWANPSVLAAVLLAKSFRENGASMGLGSIMSLGGMPYHFVNDQYGDQVALPCTERNLSLEKVEKAMARGVMPVVSIKGRDEIRLASFQSMAGGDILGPWTNVPPPPPSPPDPEPVSVASEPDEDVESDLDDLLADFQDDEDEADDSIGDEDMDAELAALLDDL